MFRRVRGRSLLGEQPTALQQPAAYQLGFSDAPVSVVLTKTNAGDPAALDGDGGNTWLQRLIRHPRVRRTAARVGRTTRRLWLRSARARHRPSPTRVWLLVPGGLDPNDPSGSSSSSVISPQSRWPGGLRCSSRADCTRTSREPWSQ